MTPRGEFEPDVYVELDTGARIAVEVQYSPGDLAKLVAKHEGYKAAGITAWWVYGSWPQTFRRTNPGRRGDARVKLIGTQVQLLRFGAPFFWFNVKQEAFAVPYVRQDRVFPAASGELWESREPRLDAKYVTGPWPSAHTVSAKAVPLSVATVDLERATISAPFLDEIAVGKAALEEAREAAHAQARHRFQVQQAEMEAQARQVELEAQARQVDLAAQTRQADLEAQFLQDQLDEGEIRKAMEDPVYMAHVNAEFDAELGLRGVSSEEEIVVAQAERASTVEGIPRGSSKVYDGAPAAVAKKGLFGQFLSLFRSRGRR